MLPLVCPGVQIMSMLEKCLMFSEKVTSTSHDCEISFLSFSWQHNSELNCCLMISTEAYWRLAIWPQKLPHWISSQ